MERNPAQKYMSKKELDLFGHKVRKRKSRLEIVLTKYDRDNLFDRISRLKYLQEIFPKGLGLIAPLETVFVFGEAKMTFLNGEFVATLVLANAFIEHFLGSLIMSKGYVKESKKGLAAIVKCAREQHLVSYFILDRVEEMRKFRNPFIHIRDADKDRLSHKTFILKSNPGTILEEEAKRALSIMYTVAAKA